MLNLDMKLILKKLGLKKLILNLTSLLTLFALSNNVAAHGDDHPELFFDSIEVTPGLHMLFGVGGFTGGNVGLSVGSDGVVMIDNGVKTALDILLARVAKITDKPVDYLINTHIHGDHIGNNAAFGGDGARIISHDKLRKSLVAKGEASSAAIPVLTFADQITLHINGDEANIFHVENAHTDGDAIIHFKNANVIHTGDVMFNGMFPFIDGNDGGALRSVIDALARIESIANDDTKIMPGHGTLASKADVSKTIAMLKDSYQLVANMVKDGKTDEEIQSANPLSKYEEYSWGFINTEKMTAQVITAARYFPLK